MTAIATQPTEELHAGLLIGGEWRSSDRTFPVHDPSDPERVVGHAVRATREQVRAAIGAAAAAFPAWAATPIADRAAALQRAAIALQGGVEERSVLLVREQGKVLGESRQETSRLVARLQGVAASAERFAGPQVLTDQGRTVILRRPRGVAALILPWNWPISILGAVLPPALLTGNTVVVKPPSYAPLATIETLRVVAAQFPPGVVNVVTGDGGEIGPELTTSREVRKVAFTGSIDTGREILRQVSTSLKAVTLELGGNDPAILLDDFEVTEASVRKLFWAAMTTAGQVCMGLKRVYAPRALYADVVAGLEAQADAVVVGNGLDPRVTMGPLNNRPQLERVRDLVAGSRALGARVEERGTVRDEAQFARGHFHRPTIVSAVAQEAELVTCEQFGPVLPVLAYDDLDQAFAMANGTAFGLCSSIWTADPERAFALAPRFEAGYTFVNDHGPFAMDPRAPFGGWKESGIGRELGVVGTEEFLEYQSIVLREQQGGQGR